MNTLHTLLRTATIVVSMAGMLVSSVIAAPVPAPAVPAAPVQLVQSGDCYSIGMQTAAQEGGQLARATQEVRGGQQVCVIVVLVAAQGGERPRRKEIVVPMG